MSLSIRTNVASLNAQRNLNATQNTLDSSLSRLSSGFRITKAGDDAAGLGISTKLESQIRSYNQATRNANDGLSVIQATESALNEQASILTRLRELAMQSSSDGIGNTERGYVDKEAQALVSELERIARVTEYNGTKLLDGTNASGLDFQVGIASSANDVISLQTVNATTAAAAAATAATPPTGVTATNPSVGAYQTAANAAFRDALIAGAPADPGVGSAFEQADLAAAGAGAVHSFGAAVTSYAAWVVGYKTADPTYTAGNGANLEITSYASITPAQQAGLELLDATAGGGAAANPLLVPAYLAFATTLVSSGGSVGDANSAALATDVAAGNSAYWAFMTQYRQSTGVVGYGWPTVDLTSAATAAALKVLGYATTGATPAAPASAGGLGVAGLSLTTKASSLSALATVDAALATISSNRATLGATGNRLQSAVNNIQSFSESLSAANSRIKDVDVAEETSRMSRAQILSQAGVSVLAQANQMPQLALKLLG